MSLIPTGVVNVNSFYAAGHGPTGASQTLASKGYATLAAAKVYYPAALALTDELDWCAIQGALDYIYSRDLAFNGGTVNDSGGHVVLDGKYLVNRTLTNNCLSLLMEGQTPQNDGIKPGRTVIQYNGPNGTVDAPIYVLDSYIFDEGVGGGTFGTPPPGRYGNTGQVGGNTLHLRGVTFIGKSDVMTAAPTSFVSGVRLRTGQFNKVQHCTFRGLYDGVVSTGKQLFCIIAENFFSSCHRDQFANRFMNASLLLGGNFSTTIWVYNNEFSQHGRYAMFLDMRGSVDAMPLVRDNSIEAFNNSSYYAANPEWFVQGVSASTCIIGARQLDFSGNRFENAHNNVYGDVHLVECIDPSLTNNQVVGLICTGYGTPSTNAAYSTYVTTNGYGDVTNQRNYNVASASESVNVGNVGLTYAGFAYTQKPSVFVADGRGLSNIGLHKFEGGYSGPLTFYSLPVIDGTYARIVGPASTSLRTLGTAPNGHYAELHVKDTEGYRYYYDFTKFSSRSQGSYYVAGPAFPAWVASASVTKGTLKTPLVENGFTYQCTVAGTTGASAPAWTTTIGNSVPDGTVTWLCVGRSAYASENQTNEWQEHGRRRRNGTAAPTVGAWGVGDKVWHSAPSAGGVEGWVCTVGGSPGTWKTFGAIGV